jgi:hypothetical protein
MGDWEDDDWDAAADNFKPVAAAPAASSGGGAEATKGAAVLASVTEPNMAKFADEDAVQEEKVYEVVKPQVRPACARGGGEQP